MCASPGSKVGSVVGEQLDPKTFLATIKMNINPDYKLPEDIWSPRSSLSSLLGDKYMSLEPGGSDKIIPAGGEIKYTQAPANLEDLIPAGWSFEPQTGAQKKPGAGSAAPAGAAPLRAALGGVVLGWRAIRRPQIAGVFERAQR